MPLEQFFYILEAVYILISVAFTGCNLIGQDLLREYIKIECYFEIKIEIVVINKFGALFRGRLLAYFFSFMNI